MMKTYPKTYPPTIQKYALKKDSEPKVKQIDNNKCVVEYDPRRFSSRGPSGPRSTPVKYLVLASLGEKKMEKPSSTTAGLRPTSLPPSPSEVVVEVTDRGSPVSWCARYAEWKTLHDLENGL